jgi:hypothetical protein
VNIPIKLTGGTVISTNDGNDLNNGSICKIILIKCLIIIQEKKDMDLPDTRIFCGASFHF